MPPMHKQDLSYSSSSQKLYLCAAVSGAVSVLQGNEKHRYRPAVQRIPDYYYKIGELP